MQIDPIIILDYSYLGIKDGYIMELNIKYIELNQI